jgi:hypothetical protein
MTGSFVTIPLGSARQCARCGAVGTHYLTCPILQLPPGYRFSEDPNLVTPVISGEQRTTRLPAADDLSSAGVTAFTGRRPDRHSRAEPFSAGVAAR